MKKKTVITTEKREVWVVREVSPELNQSIETGDTIETWSTEVSEAEHLERKKKKNDHKEN